MTSSRRNALPEYASAFINYRIDFQSSVNETLEHIASILEPVVAPLSLVFAPFGSHPEVDNNVVRLSMFGTSGIEPAPLTPTEGPVWELMAGTTRHVWPGAVVAPSGMIGASPLPLPLSRPSRAARELTLVRRQPTPTRSTRGT